jgi:hypothetical protein
MALRKQVITIQASEVDGALTDFPVLVTRVHLDDEIVDPSGGNAAQTDGGDLKFYSDSALTNRIACEVVQFEHDSSTGADDAAIQVWVLVPSVSASVDTDFWVTYNETASQPAANATYGSQAVWAGNYAAVYHMEQDPSGSAPQILDSTSNANHGTSAGSMTSGDLVAGQVGNGLDFDGSNDHISATFATPVGDRTYEVLFKPTNGLDSSTGATFQALTGAFIDSGNRDQFFYTRQGGGNNLEYSLAVGGGFSVPLSYSHDFPANVWASAAVTRSGNNWGMFVDGSSVDTGTDSTVSTSGSRTLYIGQEGSGSYFPGVVGEYRISSVARSADWLDACYSNQFTPGTFAVKGTPADAGGGGGPTVFPWYYYQA